MEKKKVLKIISVALSVAIGVTFIYGNYCRKNNTESTYDDGVKQIDINSIYLTGSGVEVDFYDVILSKQEEVRKLIVSTQEANVSIELTDRLIEKLDFDFMKKTQKVSYTGNGYFVVDLDSLTKKDILLDKTNKTVTICIEHSYLQAIEIDPDKIMIEDVKEGLLAWGDIELSVSDYNYVERELRNRMEKEFNTASNAQNADDTALRMVKEIYEPLVKMLDSTYTVRVEFKG